LINYKKITLQESIEVMLRKDNYLNSLTDSYVSRITEYKTDVYNFIENTLMNSVIPISQSQTDVFNGSINLINSILSDRNLNINLDVNLIITNGNDNIGLPYTKENSMVMPNDYHYPPNPLGYLNVELVAHEIWHIISRNNPNLRKKVYKALGFIESKSGGLNSMKNFNKIVDDYFLNPDALSNDFYYDSVYNDKNYECYPILFKNMNPVFVLCYNGSIERLISQNSLLDYQEKYSSFSYNTHPEEIAAEHFRFFILNHDNANILSNHELYKEYSELIINELK